MIKYVDTNELGSISRELQKAANDLDFEFNAIFKRLEDIPTVTKEWVGNQAEYYFNRALLEKKQYTMFVDGIRKLGEEISTEASTMQEHINSNNRQD